MHTDKDLTPADIQTLASRDGVAAFFAALGYRTDPRLPQTPATLGVTAESLQKQIKYAERVAFQENGAETLDIYLIELSSVTVAATQGLARALRNRSGNYLLVLTDDYESLDFVLIERSLPASTSSAMVTRQVLVRPRILTVNRRTPTIVQLRVLRRFTCTETDSDAQYDKLLSAYTVADWSEPFFNNRALFSDYYLNERLRERPEWKERPENAYRQLVELLANPRERLAGQAKTRLHLLGPAFQALGFAATPSKAKDDYLVPDYRLYGPDSPDQPLALCLAYTWNRYLDGRDETRDVDKPDENPGARVVALLDAGEAPWAIVTNGKIWRLYSAKAHSRATNYYEIDLEETLATADPNEAFRYFWLLFRASAFAPRELTSDGQKRSLSFLDELLEASESYARDIGERLKDRVFEQIFPHFIEGFIEHLRSQPPLTGFQQGALLPVAQQFGLKREPDEGFRREAFQGTLTFLYRLLFLLYAESRNLLPAKEVRGYWENSLTRMKQEVADKAGTIEDQVADKLRKAYSADYTATGLYDRLLKLFAIIDKGSRDTNVPLYNGGLFLTSPDTGDSTPESENARFLLSHKIPDRHLAFGLDRLARDIDQKRQDLVFIDYKSLGVRQLGSMYEGLLEFRVRVAPEKMAVVQGKRTEEIISYSEAAKTERKVLTRGRGKNAEERIYHPGEVYLENDRRERKASGSYYTPDHIVKYIVEHAVGPVLEERFNNLRSGFREAQQAYRTKLRNAKALEKQGMKPDNPSKVAISYRHLVDDLFDVKVLDPAMGSGHFLVEAVDFICDRILGQREGFLQAFLWNPVTEFLQETRQAILTEIERQGISIDATRLTDINLLKRHVLKRCVYGVDLNPMAVELSKVSLWLDCFTLGAPLSFLDHHLKCGNSLIGTSVQSVEDELASQNKGHVADLFGGPFSGLLSSTATMLELARTPDVTVAEAERSRSLFATFEKDQAPYKNALDIWLSRHFGNPRAQEYLTLVGHDFVSEIRSGGEGLSSEYRLVIGKAETLGKEKHFFHWDLEFPEAFIDLGHGTWKNRENQGFDAVVGNPPFIHKKYIATQLPAEDKYWQKSGQFVTARGIYDTYMLFLETSVCLTHPRGRVCLLSPIPWLTQSEGRHLRTFLLQAGSLSLFDFSRDSHFQDALVKVVGVLVGRGELCNYVTICNESHSRNVGTREIEELFEGQIRIDVPQEHVHVLQKIKTHSSPLSVFYTPTFGLRACSKEPGGFTKQHFIRSKADCQTPVPYVEAEDVSGSDLHWKGRWLDYQPEQIYSPRSPDLFRNPKVLVPSLLGRRILRAVYDESGYFADQSLVCISPQYELPPLSSGIDRPSLKSIQAQLNSETISFYFGQVVVGEALGGGAIHATPGLIGHLPIFPSLLLGADAEDIDDEITIVCGLTQDERRVVHDWVLQEKAS